MGSHTGAIKTAAARLGITVAEYTARSATEKWCTACKVWRPHTAFATDRSRGDGLKSTCRSHDARSDGHPSKSERRTAKTQGEAWCRRCEAWLSIGEVRSGLCRPHANEYAREHYRATDGRGRKGRADKRGVAVVGAGTRAMLMETTRGMCGYGCGRAATTLDHVIPVAAGGVTGPGLMVPACTSCNSSKRDSDPWPWVLKFTDDALSLVEPGLAYDGAVLDLVGG